MLLAMKATTRMAQISCLHVNEALHFCSKELRTCQALRPVIRARETIFGVYVYILDATMRSRVLQCGYAEKVCEEFEG
jgi:hypothetical protein